MAENDDGLLQIGGKFGDYDVIKLLGRGGMGEVYLLRSPADGEFYAAKIMFPPKGSDAHEMRRRFANEASIAMQVVHKNLIHVFDVGEDPDTHLCYIIMEYLGGGSLADKIKKRGSLPVRDAVGITMEVALALEASHRAGIIHRDIKPDNILFSDDGTPKLVDLGIAKMDDGRSTTVTMTGVIIGTPAYMAPEQMLDSHNVDARADVYSLGVVLYEMLSGKRPNSGSTAMELLARAVRGEELPDVRTLRPEVSATLGYVLSRMTAIKAENRISSALEAAKMLHDAFTGELKPPLVRKRPATVMNGRRILPAFGIAAASVLFAALLFFAVRGMRQPAVVTQVTTGAAASGMGNGSHAGGAADGAEGETTGPDADGVYSARVDGYRWFFKNVGGKAVLSRHVVDGNMCPCVEPCPSGKFIIPREINGLLVAGIGESAFKFCSDMEEAVLPNTLETIAPYAFSGSGIRRVSLPESLKEIEGLAFWDTTLDYVDIGRCTAVDKICFTGCREIKELCIDKDNPKYMLDGRCLYSRDGKTLVKNLDTQGRKLKLRSGVEVIGPHSIAEVKLDEDTLILPEGIRTIADGAFWFQVVNTVVFPRSLEKIGEHVLLYCENQKTFRFLGDAPEARPNTLEHAPDNLVVEVERGSKGWNGPGSTDLPERWPLNAGAHSRRIRYIGETDAEVAARLDKASVPDKDGVRSAHVDGYKWFYKEDHGKVTLSRHVVDGSRLPCIEPMPSGKVVIPREINGFPVIGIGEGALESCDGMEEAVLPDTIEWIGRFSFARSGVKRVSLPGSIKILDAFAFDATPLEHVDIGRCGSFNKPSFTGCKIKSVTIAEDNPKLMVDGMSVYSRDGKSLVKFLDSRNRVLKLRSGVETIGEYSIAEVRLDEENVTLPEGVRKVNVSAFWYQLNIKSVVFPRSLEKIDSWFLYGCSGLETVRFLGDAPHAMGNSFDTTPTDLVIEVARGSRGWNGPGSTDLPERWPLDGGVHSRRIRYIDETDAEVAARQGKEPLPDEDGFYTAHVGKYDWTYRLNSDGTAALCRSGDLTPCVSPKPEGELVVPDSFYGHKVTDIHPLAFRFCDKMTRIVLPAHLENLQWHCAGNIFSSCHALASIEISKDNRKLVSYNGALYTKDRKTLVAYPKARNEIKLSRETTNIGGDAFNSCMFRVAVIPEGVESIQSWAFCVCPNLVAVELPRSLGWVGVEVFHSTPMLRHVVFCGDAPVVSTNGRNNMLSRSAGGLVVKVERGTRGWNKKGEAGLPARWPVDAGDATRPIAYK